MSAQTPTPTTPQAGQPGGEAQGQPVPAEPQLAPEEELFRKVQSRVDGYTQAALDRLRKQAEAAFANPQGQQPAQAAQCRNPMGQERGSCLWNDA
jgi:hypothetical protein